MQKSSHNDLAGWKRLQAQLRRWSKASCYTTIRGHILDKSHYAYWTVSISATLLVIKYSNEACKCNRSIVNAAYRLRLSLSTNQLLHVLPINRSALTRGLGPSLDLLPFGIRLPENFPWSSARNSEFANSVALSTQRLHNCLWPTSAEYNHSPHISLSLSGRIENGREVRGLHHGNYHTTASLSRTILAGDYVHTYGVSI